MNSNEENEICFHVYTELTPAREILEQKVHFDRAHSPSPGILYTYTAYKMTIIRG